MKVGQSGKNLFEAWEGMRTKVYLDSGGAPTIGIGHLLTRSERLSGKITVGTVTLDYRGGLTIQECWDLLDQDLEEAERVVNEVITVSLTQNQYDALVSFCFNVGSQAFKNSTLVRRLNAEEYGAVPAQLRRWNKDNGIVVQGLTNRREKEIALWNEVNDETETAATGVA